MYRAIYICAFFFVNMPLQKLLNCYIADNIYRYFCATCNNYFLLLLLLESIFDRNFVMFYYYLCLLGRQAELFFFFMSLVFDFYINNLYIFLGTKMRRVFHYYYTYWLLGSTSKLYYLFF